MFPKPRSPWAIKLMKGLIALEIVGVFGAYGLFQMMNSSQDFRNTMNRKFPSVLEVYYQSNEWSGIHGIREKDNKAWAAKQE